jgi:hypothetical protein
MLGGPTPKLPGLATGAPPARPPSIGTKMAYERRLHCAGNVRLDQSARYSVVCVIARRLRQMRSRRTIGAASPLEGSAFPHVARQREQKARVLDSRIRKETRSNRIAGKPVRFARDPFAMHPTDPRRRERQFRRKAGRKHLLESFPQGSASDSQAASQITGPSSGRGHAIILTAGARAPD